MATQTPPPHGGQGYPPQGYYPPQQPAKKSHTLRNVLLVLVLLFVLFVGGCMALVGMAANEVDKAITEEEANDKPVAVEEGKPFEHDSYAVDGGWTVTTKQFEGTTINGLRVTNNGETGRTALLTFTFYKGKENLGEVECSSNELQPGESSTVDCTGFGERIEGYDTIKVADMF